MKNLEIYSLLFLLASMGSALVPERLTSQKYEEIMEEFNNVHYFILN